jgi:hypothetical protein
VPEPVSETRSNPGSIKLAGMEEKLLASRRLPEVKSENLNGLTSRRRTHGLSKRMPGLALAGELQTGGTRRRPLMRHRNALLRADGPSETARATGPLGCRVIGNWWGWGVKMKRIHSAPDSGKRPDSAGWDFSCHKDRPSGIRFGERTKMRAFIVAIAALSLISDGAFGQTTRTSPSASSTSKSIPSSSSTSPNSPCSSTNPTSPCYSANAPRNPCYSAVAPNEPCSTTTTPNLQTSPAPSPPAATTSLATDRAFTADQAKVQIEAQGYSNVSGLRKDLKGVWRGKAVKDGLPVNMTLDVDGNVTAN